MAFELVCPDEPTLQRDVVAEQRISDNSLAASEVLARVTGLHGWPLHTELLAVDAAVEYVEIERIVRKDGQLGDGVADSVVGRLERRLAQVLAVGCIEHMVGHVARTRHDQVAVVHRLSEDDGRQIVRIGGLLDVCRFSFSCRTDLLMSRDLGYS
jgi:hypothetical protein